MNKVGLAGASNAFFSALAIFAGILGYAVSSHIDNSIDIETADYSILLDLLLVLGSILGFLVIFQISRHFYNKYSSNLPFVGMFSNKSQELMGSTWHMNKSSGKEHSTEKKAQEGSFFNEEGIPKDIDNVDPENPKGNNIHEDNDIIKAMLFGRIGCRPDIPSEFCEVAIGNNTKSVTNQPGNIGVLACGPTKLVESVNTLCNKQPCFSWGLCNEDGSKTFFSFAEEDWEW